MRYGIQVLADKHIIIVKPMEMCNVVISLTEYLKRGIIDPDGFIDCCKILLIGAKNNKDEDAVTELAKTLSDITGLECPI